MLTDHERLEYVGYCLFARARNAAFDLLGTVNKYPVRISGVVFGSRTVLITGVSAKKIFWFVWRIHVEAVYRPGTFDYMLATHESIVRCQAYEGVRFPAWLRLRAKEAGNDS